MWLPDTSSSSLGGLGHGCPTTDASVIGAGNRGDEEHIWCCGVGRMHKGVLRTLAQTEHYMLTVLKRIIVQRQEHSSTQSSHQRCDHHTRRQGTWQPSPPATSLQLVEKRAGYHTATPPAVRSFGVYCGTFEVRQVPLTLKGRGTINIVKATERGAVLGRTLKVVPFRVRGEDFALLSRSHRDIAPIAQPSGLKTGAVSGLCQCTMPDNVDPSETYPHLCNQTG